MIKIDNISKSFGDLKVIEDFSLEFEKGKVYCIYGNSGSGKTTLLSIITGLLKVDSGGLINIEDKRFSYVFQEDRLLPWASSIDNIAFVLKDKYGKLESIKKASKMLDFMGLSEFKNYLPKELSGGMKRRVSLARALAYEADIIILDEPFKGLDYKIKSSIIKNFSKYVQVENSYIIIVTHDMQEAVELSDIIYKVNGLPIKVIEKITVDKNKKNNLL